jgi:hypothetical protein
MIVKNQKFTLLKVEHKSGVAKTSKKDYSFYSATCIDAEANVFKMNLSDTIMSDEKQKKEILALLNVQIVAEIDIKPKGFDFGITLVDFDVTE